MYSSTHLARLGLRTSSQRQYFYSKPQTQTKEAHARTSSYLRHANANAQTRMQTQRGGATMRSADRSSPVLTAPASSRSPIPSDRLDTEYERQRQYQAADRRLAELLRRQRKDRKKKQQAAEVSRTSSGTSPSSSSITNDDDDYGEESSMSFPTRNSTHQNGSDDQLENHLSPESNEKTHLQPSLIQGVDDLRERSVILLNAILKNLELSKDIEVALHSKHQEISSEYRKHIRDLLFNLRKNPLLSSSLCNGSLTPNELITMESEQLANPRLVKQRRIDQEVEDEERILKPVSGTYTEDHRCSACKAFKCEYVVLKESRGAAKADTWGSKDDHDSVIRLRCLQCMNEWTKEY